ncbi:MAG: hypothetical protein GY903_33860 [Fuerstiella sp.]|nr:hypothetical protein [Fuerstiella sp.]MCP4859480.1 hypothetical protein [Fuerstiella sp.]
MRDLHVHLHLGAESLTSAEGAIHVHLEVEGEGVRHKRTELSGGNAPATSGMTSGCAPTMPSGRTSGCRTNSLAAEQFTSGLPLDTQSKIRLRSLRDE